jgi:hypothetical protein
MISQNGFLGTTGPEMRSPASAFGTEHGVQASVDFWDPLKLAADSDVDAVKRRRAAELKHGRICMLAALGHIVPESKMPIEGWLQTGFFLGHIEGKFFRQDPKRAPGDLEGYGFLGVGKTSSSLRGGLDQGSGGAQE